MHKWSFHLQVYFLGHRAEQHLEMWNDPRSAIIDRSIYEDAYIFCRALNHMGNLSELEYQTYRKVFDLLVRHLPAPSLLIYLKAPVEVLMKRIQRRARNMETGISMDYLSLLDTFYDDWMRNFDLCPVLTLQTNDLDFVHKPKHLDIVVDRIQEKLAGKEEVIFPSNGN
jgi:deoxyadenosine/deoxycytidine kinase